MRIDPSLIAALFVTSAAVAQQTWTVPSGADLTSFIAAAAPGDTLQLSGTHPPFTLNKGLHLNGYGTQIVPAQGSPTTTTIQIPAGERASLSRIYFQSGTVVRGDVAIESCNSFLAGGTFTIASGTVLVRNCQFTGYGSLPLLVSGGTCSLVGCTAVGNDAQGSSSVNSAPGLRQTGGILWVSDCLVRGGSIGDRFGAPFGSSQPAFIAAGGQAFVVNSTLAGGGGTDYFGTLFFGSPAIFGGNQVEHARCSLAWGEFPNQGSPAGTARSVPDLVSIRTTGFPVMNFAFQVSAVAGASQQMLFLTSSLAPTATAHPLALQPVLGGGNGLVVERVLLTPAPGGALTSSFVIPFVPALLNTCVSWQAFQWNGTMVQASPIASIVIR